MIVKGAKQLGNFRKGINLYVPRRRIVSAVPGSLLFNNPNQFLQFPRSEVISILAAEPFTIEAWIRPTSIKTIAAVDANGNPDPLDYGDIIIGDTANGGNNWSLQLFNNKLTFYRYNSALGGARFFTSNTQIPLNTWTHVAVSYDGGSTLLIFINGELDRTFVDYSPPDTQYSVITIGNLFNTGTLASGNGAFAYKGYITNLRINDNQIFYHMVSPFEPTAPLGHISGTTLLLLANTNDPTKDSSPRNITITNVGSVASSAQYPTVADCANNDAKVLMVGWPVGPRALTRDSENLYTYYAGGSPGDETVYRANSSSPWIYTNAGIPLATSLTVSQFPWQAVWPTSPYTYTATKVCPAAPDIDNMFFPSLWLDASTGVNKFNYNYVSEIVISGTSNPDFAGTYTVDSVPTWNFEDSKINTYSLTGPEGKSMIWDTSAFVLGASGEPEDSFYSADGENWTAGSSYVYQIVITGFSGIYDGANGTYNGDGNYFTRVGGGFFIEAGVLKDTEYQTEIAVAPANYSGAWTPINYASRVALSGATNATVINGNYDATEAFFVNSWGNSNGSYIYFDGGYVVTNVDFSNAYSSSDLEVWSGSPEPAPSGAVTYTPRSVGSPTSTSSSKPTGSVSGVVTITTENTDYVTGWADQSGNGRNASQASSNPPSYSLIGGKSFIAFPSGVSLFTNSIWSNVQFVGTIITVARFESSFASVLLSQEGVEGNLTFFRRYNATNSFAITTDDIDVVSSSSLADDNTNYLLGATLGESPTATLYLNGAFVGSGGITVNTGYPFGTYIGGGSGSSSIAEMVVYNRVLNTSERQEVENYLMEKYAITAAPSGLPVASTPSIVVVGSGGVSPGTYDAQDLENVVADFDQAYFLAGLPPFYSKTQAGGNADLYFFLGPNASLLDFEGSNYHTNGPSWQIIRLFDNEGLTLVSVGTNPSTNADYIPTSGWTPSITITAA